MAEFTYRSRIYGDRVFTVPDEGGTVVYKGQQLDVFGGYLRTGAERHALRADSTSLERVARRWWRLRTNHLEMFGHQSNGVDP